MKIIFGILITILLCILVACVAVTRPIFSTKQQLDPKFIVSSEKLHTHVKYLSESCVPRDHEHIKNLDMAASYIKNQLSDSSDTVEFQTFSANNQTYNNVIAIYGPDTEEIYVVGAHYDAFLDLPGADDNASGVAGLIELGKLLSKVNLKTRVLLAAYTLEEPPFFRSDEMGSAGTCKVPL